MKDDKISELSKAIEKAHTLSLQFSPGGLVRRGIQDIESLLNDSQRLELDSNSTLPMGPAEFTALLQWAARQGHASHIQNLINLGADINAMGSDGYTPLLNAAQFGHKETVEALISNGADVNTKGIHGESPLFLAIFTGNDEIAKLLIRKGANVNIWERFSPLHTAATTGSIEIAYLLIACGAEVDAKTKDEDEGVSPLHVTCRNGNFEIAELLVYLGADINAKDARGLTPLKSAIWGGHTKIVNMLRNYGAKE